MWGRSGGSCGTLDYRAQRIRTTAGREIVVAAALNEWAARMLGYPEGVTDGNRRGQLQEFVGLNQQMDELAEDLRQATGFNFYLWRDGRRRFRYIRRITRLSRDERAYLRMLLQDVGEGPRRRKRKLEQ